MKARSLLYSSSMRLVTLVLIIAALSGASVALARPSIAMGLRQSVMGWVDRMVANDKK
jgi:hypothetical protein